MQVIKINQKKDTENFQKAHDLANEKAKNILGEYLNIAFCNEDQKLISPTLNACCGHRKKNCGADSYAKALEAELEIDVNGKFRFYYRHVQDYDTPSPSRHLFDTTKIQTSWQ